MSADLTPWLYEARQLEGDILMVRSRKKSEDGAVDAAVRDLMDAADAYARGLAVARSDFWLREAESRRLMRLIELDQAAGSPDASLLIRLVESAESAAIVHPVLAGPLLLECRSVLRRAHELDPRRSDLAGLEEQIEISISESHGTNGG
jgi:hypothetical protein